jgi:hypothetical protein
MASVSPTKSPGLVFFGWLCGEGWWMSEQDLGKDLCEQSSVTGACASCGKVVWGGCGRGWAGGRAAAPSPSIRAHLLSRSVMRSGPLAARIASTTKYSMHLTLPASRGS